MERLVTDKQTAMEIVAEMRTSGATTVKVTVGSVSIEAVYPAKVPLAEPVPVMESPEAEALRRKRQEAEFDRVVYGV